MNNKRRILGILAALVLAIVGTVALVGYVQSAKNNAVSDEALVDVYVVDKLVPKGAEAQTIEASVSIERVPARLKQPGAVTNLDVVGDNVAAADLLPGDQLLAARLVPREDVTDEVTDKVQVSALFEPERAVGGALKKGDLVAVYLSFDPFEIDSAGGLPKPFDTTETTAATTTVVTAPGDTLVVPPTNQGPSTTPKVTRLEFQHVLVTNVQTINAPVSPTATDNTGVVQVTGSQYVVTLALSPEQSERFVFATEFGRVWLAIDPASVADDGTRPITLGTVFAVAS